MPIFERMIPPIDRALLDARLQKNEIDDVILAGGSTRIPYVKERLEEYFENQVGINKQSNPDQCVARGAALYAHIKANPSENFANFKFINAVQDKQNQDSLLLETIKNIKEILTQTFNAQKDREAIRVQPNGQDGPEIQKPKPLALNQDSPIAIELGSHTAKIGRWNNNTNIEEN